MSSISIEYDYIGLSESSPSSMERISDKFSSSSSSSSFPDDTNTNGKMKTLMLNLKDTELRLGLPGSLSPERKPLISPSGVSLFGKELDTSNDNNNRFSLKNLVSGAKRGFSDTIDGSSGKWVFSVGSNGSDVVDLSSNGGVLFSPRGDNGNSFKKEGVGVGVQSPKPVQEKNNQVVSATANDNCSAPPAAKAQVVGWPPIRSFRKNTMASNLVKNSEDVEAKSGYECLYVKVSMDGAPYLRKVDLNTCSNYVELSSALEKMFSCFTIGQCVSHGLPGRDGLSESRLKDILHGSEYVLTYEDKDGDWMLVGDVPWGMFMDSCRRLRIMKGSEAIGLGRSRNGMLANNV